MINISKRFLNYFLLFDLIQSSFKGHFPNIDIIIFIFKLENNKYETFKMDLIIINTNLMTENKSILLYNVIRVLSYCLIPFFLSFIRVFFNLKIKII
jgi:hypothetical protein